MTNAFAIRARRQDLADYGERQRFPKEVLWVPAPPDNSATVVHVAIARVQEEPLNLGGMVPFHAFTLADGRAVFLLASMLNVPAVTSQDIDSVIRQIREAADLK